MEYRGKAEVGGCVNYHFPALSIANTRIFLLYRPCLQRMQHLINFFPGSLPLLSALWSILTRKS